MAVVTDLRIVRLKLDDAIAQDDKFRFGISVADKLVLLRFPTYGKWDEYAHDMSRLMILLSQTVGDIELNTDNYDTTEFSNYALILGYVLRVKACRELVEKIFLTHLRPEVQGLEYPPVPKFKRRRSTDPFMTQEIHAEQFREAFTRYWLETHLDSSHLFAMFQSILHPEEWLKKKAQTELANLPTFQQQTKQSSIPTSQPSSAARSPNSVATQPFSFVQ